MRPARMIRLALLVALTAPEGLRSQPTDPLLESFRDPPAQARPFVFWNWLNGNVTQDGIRRDLAWMKRAGIGGMLAFEAELNVPQRIDQPLVYRSPQWHEMIKVAVSEAQRNGLDLVVLAAPGWSESGGPWVTPQQAMKKLVWSETRLSGGRAFDGRLAPVLRAAGPFQDIVKRDLVSFGRPLAPRSGLDLYSDIAVLAFPRPADDVPLASLGPVFTSNAGTIDASALMDGRYDAKQIVTMPADGSPLWFQYSFARPVAFRALTLGLGAPGVLSSSIPAGTLEASDDGRTFRTIAKVADGFSAFGGTLALGTFAFPDTRARFWRLTVPSSPAASVMPGTPPPRRFELTELSFHTGARVDRSEAKAGFMVADDYAALSTPQGDGPVRALSAQAVSRGDMLDLTDKLRADGTLDWTPPKGEWIVLRFGYSLTGAANHPAVPEATGLEVDKLNAAHVRSHIAQMMGPFLAARAPGPHGLRGIETDSWEVGQGNWTEAMADEFQRLRGYAIRPWLPAVAGYVVGSPAQSDRFLWDLRRTVADLLAEKHYETFADFAHQNGLDYYAEAMGVGTPTIGDALANKRRSDVPMGEFWATRPDEPSNPTHVGDILEAASAAHVSGKTLVGAESFTAWPSSPPFTATPWSLKPLADRFLALGVNRFIIHTSPHQPTEDAPGMTLGPFGQFFTRHESWGEMASGWTDYLARSSHLLQQGRFAADVAYLYGEGAAGSIGDVTKLNPALTTRYAVDFIDRETLLTSLNVENGALTTASGMRYRLLVLPASTNRMSLSAIRRIGDLVEKGAILLGPRPEGAIGMSDEDDAVRTIAQDVWGNMTGPHPFGRGRVYRQGGIEEVLAAEGVRPPLAFDGDVPLVSIRRTLADGSDLWFVANQGAAPVTVTGRFRIAGREPEFWSPADGTRAPASFHIDGEVTDIPLALAPYESVFVLFRKPAVRSSRTVAEVREHGLSVLDKDWEVSFQSGRGAPATTHMPRLVPLNENAEPGIRYFSGVATYRTRFTLDAAAPGTLMLELGKVGDVAHVRVNGCDAGIAWKPPYRVRLGNCARSGSNVLEIDVANVWANRLIGDAQPGATPIARTSMPFAAPGSVGGFAAPAYRADSPLYTAGLIGPVRLLTVEGGPE